MFEYARAASLGLVLAAGLANASTAQTVDLDLKFAGTMAFSETGTLFVGDNYNGAIYAFDMTGAAAPDAIVPVRISDIRL